MVEAEIIIIGGGAAGLMAAAGAAAMLEGKDKVLVLEKMPRPGRKIMITGKGRCNFTNVKAWNEFSRHVYPKANFLKPAFHNLSPDKLLDFMHDHGMDAIVERGERAFPASQKSSDVVDTLVRAAEQAGAKIVCNAEISELKREGKDFVLKSRNGHEYGCKKLIICSGGLSYPKTGSSGDGYIWAEAMGHSIKPLFPSLTALVPKGYKQSNSRGHIDRSTPLSELGEELQGNHLRNVGLSLEIDGNLTQEEFGDMDFTDGGIEGPIGFKLSRKAVNAIVNGSRLRITMDMKPAVEIEALNQRISVIWDEICKDKRNQNKPYKDRFKILLTKLLPLSLISAFRRLNPNTDHKSLAKTLKNWKFEIAGYVGYERCVITAGGVNLEEITAKTLESKLIPGLYFAGEVLDLDADTGGYNLQTAFSTGYLAGLSAARTLA